MKQVERLRAPPRIEFGGAVPDPYRSDYETKILDGFYETHPYVVFGHEVERMINFVVIGFTGTVLAGGGFLLFAHLLNLAQK